MALKINLKNVEQLVFFNSELRKKLPFKELFHNWALSKQSIDLKKIGQKSVIDFLNSLNQDHIKILENHFNTEVIIERVDTNLLYHFELDVNKTEEFLNTEQSLKEWFFFYRERDQIYLSTWR